VKKLKVLLVDDEIALRDGFRRLFDWEKHNCEIVGEASDGVSAYNAIEALRPDIVIMDICIPIMNGLEVIRRVRPRYPQTAFVIVSGYDDFSYCREALRLKVEEYLLKPVNFDEFSDIIDNLKIKLYHRERDSAPEAETSADRKLIYDITSYINAHLSEEISLKKLESVFFLTPGYISQIFKKELGVHYLAYLTNLRIGQAKDLLMNTDRSIVDISESVGFKDYRTFTKVFKKLENVPPSQYRKLTAREDRT